MDSIKLRLFGAPRFERNGKPVVVQRRKVTALIAYLVVTAQAHSRDALAALLWPDYDQASARGNLRRELSRVKHEFAGDLLHIEREQVGINPELDIWADVEAFKGLIAEVRNHDHSDDAACETCLGKLEEAAKLYSGDFLQGFSLPDSRSFEDWMFFQSEELRQMFAEALERLVEFYSIAGKYEAGAYHARRWLSLDNLNEEAHRWLMNLYAWQGQYAAALRQFQECKRILKDELGVAPEEETVRLYETIRARQVRPPGSQKSKGQVGEQAVPVLQGKYVQEDLLELGGYGEIYRGKDLSTGSMVVIKKLKKDILVRDTSSIQRFIQEGEALRRLNHPNIVTFLDAFVENGEHNLVMEYVSGGTLRDLLDQQGPLPIEWAIDIGLELSDALTRAHHLNIVHRDIKPENVLLSDDGTPRLMDFGVARIMNTDVKLTQTGTMLGSPLYVSPEILRNEEPEPRSDIWSFGVLLYEVLAGVPPFRGENIGSILISILDDPIPPLDKVRSDVPPALAQLIARMLEKDPEKRIQSIRQVGAELEAIRRGLEGPVLEKVSQGERSGAGASPEDGADDANRSRLTASLERAGPFVARESELARLNDDLNRALEGDGRVVLVAGEAGQGKTSLLGAFSRMAQEAHPELVTAGGNCNAYTGIGDPYLPFREILQVLAGDSDAASAAGIYHPEQRQRQEALLPVVLQRLLNKAPDLIGTIIPVHSLRPRASAGGPRMETLLAHLESEPHPHQHYAANIHQSALIEQYTRLIQELSETAPLLLILDDLQWADQGTANLLFNLGRRLRGYRIIILGAYRPDEVTMNRDGQPHPLSKVLYELQRDYGDLIIDLGKAEGRSFINQYLDIESNCLGENFRETLYKQTGGHPLFTIELLDEMRERGYLVLNEDGCWVEGPSLDWEILPARVEGAIGERINRLDEPLVRLLETASIEGEEFTAEVVSQVMNTDVSETIRYLSTKLDKKHQLVRALGSKRAGGKRLSRYRFRHILIQRYLYQRLDSVERVYQHERIGNALEQLYEGQLEEAAVQLAWHYNAAGIPEKTVVYLKMAGEQAQRAAALDEAVSYYRAALKDWPADDLAGRGDLLHRLGICLWIISRLKDALRVLEDGFAIYQDLGNWKIAGEIQRHIGRLYWEMGDREKSLHHYHQALSVLEMEPESFELARAISSISQMHMLAGEYDQAIAWGERALAMAKKLNAEDVLIHALNNIGSSYFEIGDPESGAKMLQESHLRALELRLPHDVCRALINLGEGYAGYGLYADARRVFEELYRYADMVHISVFAGTAVVEQGRLDWVSGEWNASLNRRAQIHQWLERGQAAAYLEITANVFFAMQMNDLGLYHAAYNILEKIHSIVMSFNEMQMYAPFMEQLVIALGGMGKLDEAAERLREMVDTIGDREFIVRPSVPPLLTACAWHDIHPTPATLEISRQSLVLLERAHHQSDNPFIAAAFREGQGIVHLRDGDTANAIKCFAKNADTWQAMGHVYYRVRSLSQLGSALAQAGRGRDALTVFKEAFGIFKNFGEPIEEQKLRTSFQNSPFYIQLKKGSETNK